MQEQFAAKNKIRVLENEKSILNEKNTVEINQLTQKINLIDDALPKLEERIEKERAIFEPIYQSIKNNFSGFIDERDWKNIDLIIYLYETGRALNLRDALMQVDLERRNKEIIKSIHNATKAISYTIRSGFDQIKSVVEAKFDILNQTIKTAFQSVQKTLYSLSQQNSQLIDISTAQNAILNKINISSQKMADDISFMKDIAYKEYYSYYDDNDYEDDE